MNSFNQERRALRIQTHFETLYSTGGEDGMGILADISYSGARLEKTTQKPKVGTPLRLYVTLAPTQTFELVGRVARHLENGFAIEYDFPPDPSVRRFVDDAAALVSGPRRS